MQPQMSKTGGNPLCFKGRPSFFSLSRSLCLPPCFDDFSMCEKGRPRTNTGSVPRRAARPHNTPVSSVTTALAAGRQRSAEGSKLSENLARKRRGARTSRWSAELVASGGFQHQVGLLSKRLMCRQREREKEVEKG